MAVTVNDAADFLISFAQDCGDPITNLKLQKLVYYAQAWHLALYDKPLFDAKFEAWVHGPAVSSLYGRYKKYQWNPICERVEAPELPKQAEDHLKEIYTVFGGYSAWQLECMTHAEAPWIKARNGLAPDVSSRNVISEKDMQSFYKKPR